MNARERAFLVASSILAASAAACSSGSDAAPSTPGVPSDVDAGSEASGEAGETGESLTILALLSSAAGSSPLVNGTLVFDKPGGERVELPVGADGRVTVTGIDWSQGKAAFSLFGPGTNVFSFVGFDKADIPGAWPDPENGPAVDHDLAWEVAEPETGATLKGTVTNAVGSNVMVSATNALVDYWGEATSFELTLRQSEPSKHLLAVDFSSSLGPNGWEYVAHRWVRFDQPAIEADTTRDLDLHEGTQLTPIKVKTKLVIPGGAEGPLGGSSYASLGVYSLGAGTDWENLSMGFTTRQELSADGNSLDAETEFVKLDGAKPATVAGIMLPDGVFSTALMAGWPAEGAVFDGMLMPPVVLDATRSLSEPFAIDGVSDDARALVKLTSTQGKGWSILAPRGTTSIRIPTLEGALGAAVGEPSTGVVWAVDELDPTFRYFRHYAQSRSFELSP